MDLKSVALIESLKNALLLASDLPLAPTFDRSLFGDVKKDAAINFDQKLGHLYEDALEALINGSPSLSFLASHVQIFDTNKRTLGEMDFILFDRVNGRHIHLELAVKFYLARETSDGWQFPGPNANDNWQRKLDHMQQHQLILSQMPEARSLLHARFNIETIEAQQLVYGCLFVPFDCDAPPQPQSMSVDRQEGRWLYVAQWAGHFDGVEEVLLIPKPLWPVEISLDTVPLFEKISVEELMDLAHQRCTMFMLEGTFEKLFLVPDTWG